MQTDISPQEIKRLQEMSLMEKDLRKKGYSFIAGIDEVGRGPLAGPVVAVACILPESFLLKGIDDSKKISATLRQAIYQAIVRNSDVFYGIGVVDVEIIDRINILQATLLAMKRAIENLPISPDHLLFDGHQFPSCSIPSLGITKGDSLSISIAAASIIAKVYRDELMIREHQKWPIYRFDEHKGYATKQHRNSLLKHGPCEIHRKTFEPIKSLLAKGQCFLASNRR